MSITNAQRRKNRKEEAWRLNIKPIIDRNHEDETIPHFYIDKWGCLSPKRLPRNNELVRIAPGSPDVENVLVLKEWKVAGTIHLMSNVIIWHKDVEYTYQILMSDKPGYGKFSLVNARNLEQQPGSSGRVSDDGGRKSTYY